MEGGTG